MRAESDWARAVGVGRIQDKTRWTKALGEAVTVVYGDCMGEIRRCRYRRTADHENSGQLLTQRLVATGRLKVTESRPTGGQVRIPVETMHGL
jgi:hypothetical protein